MPLLLAFLLVPLVEIALFIQIGDVIGLWWTLATVVVTAVVGATLVRRQGADILGRIQTSFETLRDPATPLAEGAMVLFSGALLLTPGFFTDAVGFALLVPAVRHAIIARVGTRIRAEAEKQARMREQAHAEAERRARGEDPARPPHGRGGPARRPDIIEGEYEVDPAGDASAGQPTSGASGEKKGPSGWTRH